MDKSLLFGPYTAPVPRRGTPSRCLIRGRVTVVGWTDAPLSWPLCVLPGRGGARSIQIDAELARAIRQESATAIRHWWGVSVQTVWRWCRALGVTRTSNPGSRRLIVAAARQGAAVIKAHVWTATERRARSRRAIKLGLGRNLKLGYHGPRWTDREIAWAELKLLGKGVHYIEVARLTGRTPVAVSVKRALMRR